MAYATYTDVTSRTSNTIDETKCAVLLEDAAVIIDAYNSNADVENKKIVSCNMVIRALSADSDVPIGATQGSMTAIGYTQSWTMGNGSSGEMYLAKLDKKLLGVANRVGCTNPYGGDTD